MEKRYGHMASLATYSRVYNLCAELEQVVQRSASSSDRQTQLYNGQCGQNGEMCTAVSSGQCASDSVDGKAEENRSVDLHKM